MCRKILFTVMVTPFINTELALPWDIHHVCHHKLLSWILQECTGYAMLLLRTPYLIFQFGHKRFMIFRPDST